MNILHSFHDRMQACVIEGSQESSPFEVKNGVKQGCVLAPVLFGIIIASMIKDAFKNCNLGVRVKYQHDGVLFKPRRLKAHTKLSYTLIHELLYASDCALTCLSEEYAQQLMDCFTRSAVCFGLTISIKKTEVIYTTKAWDHSDSTSSESQSEQAEGGGRIPLLREHHFQQLLN